MKKRIIALSALFCAYTTSVMGAGFQTLEQGASNMGNANAGATVNANADATSAFWNPSSGFNIGLKKGETKLDTALFGVISKFDFVAESVQSLDPSVNGKTGKSGNAGRESVIPNFYLVHQMEENLLFSLSVSAPYGLETDYGDAWVGREMALNSRLTTIDINPSVSYKVNDWLAISGGISVQWLHAKLTQAVPYVAMPMYGPGEFKVSGDSWAVGGNIGFTINYAEDGRIGFQWRSEVSHRVKGSNHLNGLAIAPVEADVTLPHSFSLGWYQRLRGDLKKVALMAEYCYTMWSSFEDLTIKNTATGGLISSQEEDWRNTSRVAVGLHFFPLENDDLVLRFGTAWDQTPIKNAYHRYARIPCTDRIWFSTGVGYKYENWNFDLAYTFIYFTDKPGMNDGNAYGTTLKGYFEGRAHVIGAQVGYKF